MLYDDAVVAAVDLHMSAGGPAAGWYAGVTDDIERSVRRHNIDPEGAFDCVTCVDSATARKAERHLHRLGYAGQEGRGNGGCNIVYVYRITAITVQDG